MHRLAAFCLAGCLAAAGCISVEQTITLQKDLSGTAAMVMSADLEPMAVMMARMEHLMTAGQGEPPAALIERSKQDLLAAKAADPIDIEEEKEGLRDQLPAGVKLVNASLKDEGFKLTGSFLLSFDKLTKLNELSLDPAGGETGPVGNPMEKPFEGLKIVEEGGTITITSPTQNPFAEAPGDPAHDSPMAKSMMDTVLKGFRILYKIDAPFEVIEHNATRKEGTTLVWEFDAAAIQKLTAGASAPAIRVKYKK